MMTQQTALRSPLTVALARAERGVWLAHQSGRLQLVHAWEEGDYTLTDIVDYFLLGEVLMEDGAPGVELDRKELEKLSKLAWERRHDHPSEFITMCFDIYCAAISQPGAAVTLYANF